MPELRSSANVLLPKWSSAGLPHGASEERKVPCDILLQEPFHECKILRGQYLGQFMEAEGVPIGYEPSFEDVGQIEEVDAGI